MWIHEGKDAWRNKGVARHWLTYKKKRKQTHSTALNIVSHVSCGLFCLTNQWAL